MKKWYGMRGGGRRSRDGFQTSDARREIFNEVLADVNVLGLGGFNGSERRGRREKGGKDMVSVVKGGRERRVLEP